MVQAVKVTATRIIKRNRIESLPVSKKPSITTQPESNVNWLTFETMFLHSRSSISRKDRISSLDVPEMLLLHRIDRFQQDRPAS